MVEIPVKIYVQNLAKKAREAARPLALISGEKRTQALEAMADQLDSQQEAILQANRQDVEAISKELPADAYRQALERIRLTEDHICEMAQGIRDVAALPDSTGEVTHLWRAANGMQVSRMRMPLGVIGIISDMGPYVTVESISMCVKTGNVCVYRGSGEWFQTNLTVANILRESAEAVGIPAGAVTFLDRQDREGALQLVRLTKYLDAIVPRGKAGLHKAMKEQARVPVIGYDGGVCHVYVDGDVDLPLAQSVVINSKVQDPSASNSADTLLVHQSVARHILPGLLRRLLEEFKVDIHGCPKTVSLMGLMEMTGHRGIDEAVDDVWGQKFQSRTLAVKVVESLDEALDHIAKFGPGHTDTIMTRDYATAMRFVREVDSSGVLVNMSTRLHSGDQFGLGAEIGMNNSHFHARGPLTLETLTCEKYVVLGTGQLREPHPLPEAYQDAMMMSPKF